MIEVRFEWDAAKAAANVVKHGVSFEEASTAFYDEFGLLIDDPDRSHGEDRYVLLGTGAGLRPIVVVHCLRESGQLIRIISARRANSFEAHLYRERLNP